MEEDLRGQSHAEFTGQWNNLSFEIPHQKVPPSLVDAERRFAVADSISIRRGNDPCRHIGSSEIQHLALFDKHVKTIHELFDGRGIVPVVDIVDIFTRVAVSRQEILAA